MSNDSSVFQHLETAMQLIFQERASIMILGRAYTPQEERRLEALEAAISDIESAIAHLKKPANPIAMPLPANGRYTAGNDVLALELRIDLDVSNILSSDIFAVANGHREYVASFRSEPGANLTPQSNPLSIIAEDRDGKQTRGEILFSTVIGTEITAQLTLDSQIKALPANQAITLSGRYAGSAMRELGIELESETGTDTSPTWDFNGRTLTTESCLEDAGFEIYNVGQRNQIPTPSSDKSDY